MNLQSFKKPQELLSPEFDNPIYDFGSFIKTDSFMDRRRSTQKLKLLKTVDPIVKDIIEEDEQVYYLAKGLRASMAEWLFIGWVAYYYNFFCFVFTTRRILMIHLKKVTKRGMYISAIELSDLAKVSSLFGHLKIKFRNGKSLTLSGVSGKDRKFLIEFLQSILPVPAKMDRTLPDVRNLCPKCFATVLAFPRTCNSCQSSLKTPLKASLLSLVMPGLGDIYLGSRLLGMLELLCVLVVWFSLIIVVVEEISNGAAVTLALAPMLFVFLIVHVLDAIKSNYIARKGIMLS